MRDRSAAQRNLSSKFFNRLDRCLLERRMTGQAEIIIRGKIKIRFAADFDARARRGIHAAQFAAKPLLAQGGKAFVEFVGEWRHAGIYDLRFTTKNIFHAKRNALAKAPSGTS